MTSIVRFKHLVPLLLFSGIFAPIPSEAHDPDSRIFLNGLNVGKVSFYCNAYYSKPRTLLSKYFDEQLLKTVMKETFYSYADSFSLTKSEKNKQIKDILHFTQGKCQFMKELYEF